MERSDKHQVIEKGKKKAKETWLVRLRTYLNNETSKVIWCFPTGLSGRMFYCSCNKSRQEMMSLLYCRFRGRRDTFSSFYLWDNIFEKLKTIGHVTWLQPTRECTRNWRWSCIRAGQVSNIYYLIHVRNLI